MCLVLKGDQSVLTSSIRKHHQDDIREAIVQEFSLKVAFSPVCPFGSDLEELWLRDGWFPVVGNRWCSCLLAGTCPWSSSFLELSSFFFLPSHSPQREETSPLYLELQRNQFWVYCLLRPLLHCVGGINGYFWKRALHTFIGQSLTGHYSLIIIIIAYYYRDQTFRNISILMTFYLMLNQTLYNQFSFVYYRSCIQVL